MTSPTQYLQVNVILENYCHYFFLLLFTSRKCSLYPSLSLLNIVGVNSGVGDTGEACVTARDCRLIYGITIWFELLKILEYWQTNILNNTQWRSDNIASMEGENQVEGSAMR